MARVYVPQSWKEILAQHLFLCIICATLSLVFHDDYDDFIDHVELLNEGVGRCRYGGSGGVHLDGQLSSPHGRRSWPRAPSRTILGHEGTHV